MNEEQRKGLKFYCWQLGTCTFGDLKEFKKKHKVTTNKETLEALCREYNKGENFDD